MVQATTPTTGMIWSLIFLMLTLSKLEFMNLLGLLLTHLAGQRALELPFTIGRSFKKIFLLENSYFRSVPMLLAACLDLTGISLFDKFVEQPFVKKMYLCKSIKEGNENKIPV